MGELQEGVKLDAGKVPMDLLSTPALIEVAKVLQFGAQKYAANNWRKGMKWSRLYAAAQRHLAQFQMCVDEDEETGLLHLAHAMCDVMFLLEYQLKGLGEDDRYRYDDVS